MAQNARIAALTDELIQSIIGFDQEADRRAYKHAKDIASKGLKAHQYNRTNQFEIQSRFEGLDEKFRVLDRDDLADALQDRLKELQEKHTNKWIPECLDLLLRLSDRPTENSQVEALELLRPPTPPPALTWKEIVEEDPYSDEEIWRDIDYAAESSEEEPSPVKREKKKTSPPSSIDEDDVYKPESYVVPVESEIVSEIEEAQFWKAEADEETGKVEITELQAIRETLFMLAGLPTSLYLTDKQHTNIRVNQKYVLSHAIQTTVDHLLSEFAAIGRDLYRLRLWTRRPSSLPLIQTFESAVRKRLADYDRSLATLQQQYLVPDAPIAVSLLELHSKIRDISAPLLRLSQVVADIEPELLVNPFLHLETLFQQISLAQMTLEKDIFNFFSELFFECLQTYLKPIRKWMESGELGANDETFFVFENDSGSETCSIWHDRYVLRRGKGNTLRSPEFLEPAAMKIFNTGKSVVFLRELGIYNSMSESTEVEPRLDHQTVCGTSELPLSPFSELFHSAFETWIRSKYSLASTVLRTHLFSECGLLRILEHFHILYLSANGSVFQDFADAIFERMDSKQRGWNDRFLLTELARGIYSNVLPKSDAEKIVVRSVRTKSQTRSVKGLAGITIDYALPWHISNIIQRSSIPIYQQLSTLLLQTYRAKYLLQSISLQSLSTTTTNNFKPPNLRNLATHLRITLIIFTDILRSYLSETVILHSFTSMKAAMSKAQDIDEMASIHVMYLSRMQEQALLSESLKPVLSAVLSVLDLCVVFYEADVRSSSGRKKSDKGEGGAKAERKESEKEAKRKKLRRRKSVIPAIVETVDEDEEDEEEPQESDRDVGIEGEAPARSTHDMSGGGSLESDLQMIDRELKRLLPFLTAGLRNIGRVGAEPVWEMLAERLELGGVGGKREEMGRR